MGISPVYHRLCETASFISVSPVLSIMSGTWMILNGSESKKEFLTHRRHVIHVNPIPLHPFLSSPFQTPPSSFSFQPEEPIWATRFWVFSDETPYEQSTLKSLNHLIWNSDWAYLKVTLHPKCIPWFHSLMGHMFPWKKFITNLLFKQHTPAGDGVF